MNWYTRIFYVFVLVAIIIGCEKTKGGLIDSETYFPSQVGSKWVYRITVEQNVDPLWHRVVRWPLGTREVATSVRGRFYAALIDKSKKEFRLIMAVDALSQKQGPLAYRDGVKLRIEEDELGIFYKHDVVFWAIAQDGDVLEIMTVSEPHWSSPVQDKSSFTRQQGWARRHIFFNRFPPGHEVSEVAVPFDKLLYVGRQGEQHHFRRSVGLGNEPASEIAKPFVEDIYFEKGKGLVRLEQRVSGRRSMVWELINFSKGK
jgi:hypothetical protein